MGGNQVSVERLKELFTYHPDGYLINNTTRARCAKAGKQAGLWFNKKSNKWHSAIYVDCVKKHLGCFDTKEEALKVRKQAEEEYW